MSLEFDPWQVTSALWRLLRGIHAEAAPALAVVGLDQKSFFVLHSVEGHATPGALALRTRFPAATITDVVKRLEALGYVERKLDIGDLRRHRLELTGEGKKALKHGMRAIEKQLEQRLGRLPRGERATFARLAIRLAE